MFAIRHKVLVVFVTLLVTIAFTTTAYTFDPPEPQSARASQEKFSEDSIPILLESDSILTQSHSETLRPSHGASDEPIAAIGSSNGRSAFSSAPLRQSHLIETSAFKEIELEAEPLREPLDLQAQYRKTYDLSQDHKNTRERSHSVATTCTVTTPADSGQGTLRHCLADAAPNDTINFDSQLFLPTVPVTITLLSALSSITTDRLTIDGSNAGLILDGSELSAGSGLVIDGADGVVIQGLHILNFPRDGIALINGASNALIGGDSLGVRNLISRNSRVGVWLQDPATTNNTVQGNYIGTNATGTAAQANLYGVGIGLGAQNNMIGGHTEGARNVISGNVISGVHIQDIGTTGNQVQGNYIGTDATGTARLGNENGVVISSGAQTNTIGGETAAARNVISGNTEAGIWLQDEGTSGNQVQGNYIGTDKNGTTALGNANGVLIDGAENNLVGGLTAGARNLISGNTNGGVWLQGEGASGNQVQGNYIGTDLTGMAALGNNDGVFIGFGAQNNLVGGETPAARNLISGNTDIGLQLQESGTSGNKVQGNYIGTDLTGTASLGNNYGVFIGFGAQNNLIGGEAAGMRNLISGNTEAGIWFQDEGTSGNKVQGNYIGTDLTGTAPLGNNDGVFIGFGAQRNGIGGKTVAARNLISGNTDTGIKIQNKGTISNTVQGNYIGTNATGTASLGNTLGVIILQRAQNNLIGGQTVDARNLVSGNTEAGIQIQDPETISNTVQGNYIGTDLTGTAPLSNTWGIVISNGAQNNLIGGKTASARNLISGNRKTGIQIQSEGTSGNQVWGNYIGTDVTGMVSLGNTRGIGLEFGAQNNFIGGNTANVRNLVSGNTEVGIWLQNEGTSENQVRGNYIGTDVTGMASLGNTRGVGIGFGAQNNLIGDESVGARNLISGNTKAGIHIQNKGTSGNQVQGNYIGIDLTGSASLGNTWGVLIRDEAHDNFIGGETVGARNVISGNREVGILLRDEGTSGNKVRGNYIGTDLTGTTSLGNMWGIIIKDKAQNNLVGGHIAGARNLISANEVGILLRDEKTSGNQVQGNYIGTDLTGTTSLGNTWGVAIGLAAQNNLIGGESLEARNLISGNAKTGLHIWTSGTSGNQVQGNYIGTDLMGTTSLGNTWGVIISSGPQNNLIGGESIEARNLISGNTKTGLQIQNKGTSENQVQGNYIGTDVTGSGSLGNGLNGVYLLDGASSNTIGISNTIAYNGSTGVLIEGETTLGNTITRNIIKNNGVIPIDWINIPMPISPPMLTNHSNNAFSGSTCPHCTLEIFANPNSNPAGAMFWGQVVADSEGLFSIRLDTWPTDRSYLSATVTSLDGTTSEFSSSIMVMPTSTYRLYLPAVLR